MGKLGIKDAFARYGASLRNVQWSVSAWAADGSLVVSLWQHHSRGGAPGTLEFGDKASRWAGPRNTEFRRNVQRAFESGATVRLVIARTEEVDRVQAGEDASKVKKVFFRREELTGRVAEWDGDNYVFRFSKA